MVRDASHGKPSDEGRSGAWDSWVNAETYREYVERFPVYRALNRRLVELAKLSKARRVLDLACGTGATTRACLEQLPAGAEVEAVDAAGIMVETARGDVSDPRARFRRAHASSVDRVVHGRFDRALCNAAFWLFPSPVSVLSALSRLLEPGALFVFNVPFELLANGSSEPEPFQISLAQVVRERTGHRPVPPRLLDEKLLEQAMRRNGFLYHAFSAFHYHGRQGELMELMHVPALAIQLAPELGYEGCLDVVRQAAERNDPQLEVEIRWAYFVAIRCPN